MAYIPNATDSAQPVESQAVESAALEFRTLKSRVNGLQAAVEAEDLKDLRVPEATVPEIPTAAVRAGKVLGFDAGGNPIAVAVSGVDDPSLRANLAAPTGATLVGYLPAGTDAVATTVQSKLRESVSVKDFGAVGDGVTDDTAAFAAANLALEDDDYLELLPGDNYLISGAVFTKRISIGCPLGRSSITSNTGVRWLVASGDLDVTIENVNLFPRLAPNISAKTTALKLEVTSKNLGSGGQAVIRGVKVEKGESTGFYNGIVIINQASILDGCDVILRDSHTNSAAKDGSLENWEINSGDGILLSGATYSFLRNCKVYYATTGFRAIGQIEEVHMAGCMALINRKCFVFDSLVHPANQHRLTGCHGVTYLRGIEMAASDSRIVLCSIESSSILCASDATAAQIIYATVCLDGANINNFQAFNSGTRGTNDIGIWLATAGGTGSRRVMVSGLHCNGVGTGVYLDSNERNYIATVSMLQSNMVGSPPVVYAYGPNNTSSPVTNAWGFPEQQNVFPAEVAAPAIRATSAIGLRDVNTVSANGADFFTMSNSGGNMRWSIRDSGGVMQVRGGLDQGGSFKANGVYPNTDATYTLGVPSLRWTTVYATTGTINTSDDREKTYSDIEATEILVAKELKTLMKRFKFNDAIALKGEGARIHFGASAQTVVATFAKHGLDATKYAMLCYDEWDEQPEIKDDEGNVIQEYRAAGNRYGIRYEELLAFIIGAM